MPTSDPGAPAPSAEARRLIDGYAVECEQWGAQIHGEAPPSLAAADLALSAYVAGLEAAIARGTEDGDVLHAFRAGWTQRGQFDAAQRGRAAEGGE